MEEDECCCQKELDRIPSDIPDIFAEPEKRFLDFGKVQVGRKKWLKYYIQNETEKIVEYSITRDPNVNPLYQVFNFSAYKVRVPSKSSTILKVSYHPLYPETGDVDCFQLTDSGNNTSIICTRGIGEGPSLQISTNFLRFNTWDDRKSCKHAVELRNDSEIDAVVHFDVDVNDSVFTIDKINIVIPAKKYVFFNITFTPSDYGVYGRRIDCLVLHHEPILLEIFGVHTRKNELRDFALIYCPRKGIIGRNYSSYVQDVQMVMQENPMFSLTENYIDFGGVSLVTGKTDFFNKTMVTSLTNHMQSSITVKFEEDAIFKINPNVVEIPSCESVLFECKFCPDRPDFVYHKKYSGTVLWKDERAFSKEFKRLEIPLSFTLTLLGHSFFDNTFWIPQLEIIPEVIILPPAVPGTASYCTFQLKTRGYLPVSFKFLPPKKTNFIIKPMLGLVSDYRLLVAQLQSEARKQPKVYVEQWAVIQNDRKDHLIHFYLKGFSELPSLIIGDQNRVKFGCVQTGCKERICVPVKNNCQHRLRYKFMIDEMDYLEITNSVGELAPNETVHLYWYFQSSSNACVKYTVNCLVHVLEKMRGVVGAPFDMPVEVYTESTFSELCCFPSHHDLGTVECEVRKTLCFSLHNYGPTIVHYCLEKVMTADDSSTIDLVGSIGSINPNEKNTIIVEYIPKGVGQHDVTVIYKIRKCCDTPEVLENYERVLFRIRCESLYPYFQIIDIVHHNFGKLFTKPSLWDLFNITDLNEALKVLEHDHVQQLEVRTPDFEISEEVRFAVFLLKNVTPFPLDVELKRRQVCDCKLQETGDSLSMRKKQFDCPHRQMFSVLMDKGTIQPDSLQTFQLHVRYTIEGENLMSYEMIFPWDRRLILNFTIKSLTDSDSVLSKYTPTFGLTLNQVCLSEKEPQIQAFWFYNNTDKAVDYSLDLEAIESINCVYEYEIFKCLNPDGVIEEYCRKALMFRFMPIMRKTFQVVLPLRMGNEETMFLLSGDGRKSFQGYIRTAEKIVPSIKFDVPVTLSEDYVQVNPIPIWSSASVLVFIRNTSVQSVIGYSWVGCKMDEIIEVFAESRKGVLSPYDSHPLILQIRSFGKPCKLRLQICCKLLNHSEYYLHKKSMVAYNCRQEQIKDEFTITEHGVTYPTNDIIVHPFPKQFFTNLCIDVTVTSVPDRDIHHNPREQMAHSPVNNLSVQGYLLDKLSLELQHSSQESIFTTAIYFERKEAMEKRKKLCGGGWKFESSSEEDTESLQEEEDYFENEDPEFYKHTLECLIADAVFSSLYLEILKRRRVEAPLYYEQIRTQREDKDAASKREKYIQELYDDPPPPLLAEIFKKIIFDGLEEVFDLGLQATKRSCSGVMKKCSETCV